ncbi:MAG: plastocyanin [Parcubacteria group bacterium Gr01-1014_2]|nr:MAG: plastocyanin [Parcubacteria group bacterium Gr01-1014_2]
MKNSLTLIIVVILLVVSGIFLFGRQSNGPEVLPSPTPTPNTNSTVSPQITPTPTAIQTPQSSVKEFRITGSPFKFDVKEIKVKKGDRVRIVFRNAEGMHDWVIDEFNARTKQLQAEQQETIEFIADKKGQFQYYCSVGTHRQMGMWGALIVE